MRRSGDSPAQKHPSQLLDLRGKVEMDRNVGDAETRMRVLVDKGV